MPSHKWYGYIKTFALVDQETLPLESQKILYPFSGVRPAGKGTKPLVRKAIPPVLLECVFKLFYKTKQSSDVLYGQAVFR